MRSTTSRRTLAAELVELGALTQIRLQGWVHRHRVLARVSFLVLRDRSGVVQVVITDPALRAATAGLAEESVVEVVGTLTRREQAPGGVEVQASSVEVLSPATAVPLELWRPTLAAGLPAQLDHAALSWRHPARRARWQVAAAAVQGFRRTLDGTGFVEVQTPKIVGSATESGADVFRLDYFRSTRLPGPVAAVLQADAGRRLRTGVRGGSGLSG
ncbi:MAG: OB-fold nucleic acid binding domain-containing protein [Propionibacteriaceae bacterium]